MHGAAARCVHDGKAGRILVGADVDGLGLHDIVDHHDAALDGLFALHAVVALLAVDDCRRRVVSGLLDRVDHELADRVRGHARGIGWRGRRL